MDQKRTQKDSFTIDKPPSFSEVVGCTGKHVCLDYGLTILQPSSDNCMIE